MTQSLTTTVVVFAKRPSLFPFINPRCPSSLESNSNGALSFFCLGSFPFSTLKLPPGVNSVFDVFYFKNKFQLFTTMPPDPI
jgi:hypothetical protein